MLKDWIGLSEFVASAEQGSFTAAAQQLGCSVAQVSRNIRTLEQQLQVQLFARSTRQLHLTSAGAQYLAQCRPLLYGLQQARQQLLDLQSQPSGQLKITAPVFYGETVLAPLLWQFMARYPQLQLELDLSNQQRDLVKDGFDCAIRLGQLQDSDLQARRLGSRQLFLVASPAYLQSMPPVQSLADLAQQRCLVGSVDIWRFDTPVAVASQSAGRAQPLQYKPQPYLKCNSGVALADAAKRGLGITQLPDYYLQDALGSGQLVALLPELQPRDDGIWALYPLNPHLPQKVRLLLDFLQQQLAT